MLVRPGADAEPAVVAHIEQPARPFPRWHGFAWKDDFVTDQGTHARGPGHREGTPVIASGKPPFHLCQLRQAQAFQQTLERQKLAKRDEVHLVIAPENCAAVIDYVDGRMR